MPLATASSQACAALCQSEPFCNLFTFHYAGCSYDSTSCSLAGGCCYLKHTEVPGIAPRINNCTCSGYSRVPGSMRFKDERAPTPAGQATVSKRNVLYILVDDLRPDLETYGQVTLL